MILACYNGQLAAAKLLIAAGAAIDAADFEGIRYSLGAAFKGNLAIAELLTANVASLDLQHGNMATGTALIFAVMFGRNDM